MSTHLSYGELEVRYVFLADEDEAAFTALLPHLDGPEQIQAKRFLQRGDRLAYATGRALVRRMLSAHAISPTEGWRFNPDRHGKPAIARDSSVPDLRFNISHCRGIVAAAMSVGREVGVDVEFTGLRLDHLELARTCFAAEEVKQLEALSGPQRRDAFFALWTLKEAYLKAKGKGLRVPLSEFAFTLDPLAIISREEGPDKLGNWFLWQHHLTPSHLLSVVAEQFDKQELTCRARGLKLSDLVAGAY